jgi:anti-sigma28 factor (negative regulator of flagellin synthesis)
MTQAQEIAEILTAYTEEQRRAALNQHRWRKITLARVVGDTQIQCETVVDEQASGAEVYAALAPLDAAVDRLKAKSEIVAHYETISSCVGQIEVSAKARARDRYEFARKNQQQNANRRNEIVGLTAQQNSMLSVHGEAMKANFERIEELRSVIARLVRVVDGGDPIAVKAMHIDERLDALRGERQDAA